MQSLIVKIVTSDALHVFFFFFYMFLFPLNFALFCMFWFCSNDFFYVFSSQTFLIFFQ